MSTAAPVPAAAWRGVTEFNRMRWPVNACWRYRLVDRARFAVRHGLVMHLGHVDDVHGPCAGVVVLRPSGAVQIERLRRRLPGVPIIGDWDDLLFSDPEGMPAVITGLRTLAEQRLLNTAAREALHLVDHALVSTAPLAEAIRRERPQLAVTVARNELDPQWIAQGRSLYQAWRPGMPRAIHWLVGSQAREADLAVAAGALERFTARHPEITIRVVGPLDARSIPELRLRISHAPLMHFDHLAGSYAGAWVTIAPLADLPFNLAKSAIKVSEAAAFGAPCIATPTPAIHADCPDWALSAGQPAEWEEHLEALLDDERRMALGVRLMAAADRDAASRSGDQAWCAALRTAVP